MLLGTYEVPEFRIDTLQDDIKKVYDSILSDEIGSNDLAKMLGYAANTSGNFYRKTSSMQYFGLLEGRGTFKVSELGKGLAHPESEEDKKRLLNQAVFHVKLWNEIYKKWKKDPPTDNFWVQIKNITGIESPQAQKISSQVRKWYLDDVANISEEFLDDIASSEESGTKDLSFGKGKSKPVSQQLFQHERDPNTLGVLSVNGIGNIDITDEDSITLAESALKNLRKKLSKSTVSTKPEENTQN